MLLWIQIEILFLLQTLGNMCIHPTQPRKILQSFSRRRFNLMTLTETLPVFRLLRSMQTDPSSAGCDQKWCVCCAWWSNSFQRGQLCHLSSTSPLSLPLTHPPNHLGLPQWQYENFLSLDKSLPQLKIFFLLQFLPVVADETWAWNGFIEVISAQWQSWHKQKPFVFIHQGTRRAASLYCGSN